MQAKGVGGYEGGQRRRGVVCGGVSEWSGEGEGGGVWVCGVCDGGVWGV